MDWFFRFSAIYRPEVIVNDSAKWFMQFTCGK